MISKQGWINLYKPKNITFHETETMIDSISELIHIDTKKNTTTSNLRNASNTVKVIEAIEKSSKQSSSEHQ